MKIVSSSILIVLMLSSGIVGPLSLNSNNIPTVFAEKGGSNKITICHIPPGNPDNAQIITISENALDAHLAHGDTIDNCPNLLAEEYLELIAKLDNVGNNIGETTITPEFIEEIHDDLDRIKQIVIELQTSGFDGEGTASRIDGQTIGHVEFFDENTGETLFDIDIPNGTLGLFIIFGLIEEFENTSGEFTLDEQIGMIEESLEFSIAITNIDDETLASNFVLSAIGAYHPSTGNTFFIPIAIILLKIAFQECITSGVCEVIATFAAQYLIEEVLPQAFPTIGIPIFNFNDIDGDGDFMESDLNFPLEGFEFTLASQNFQIIVPPPETSGSDGFLRFTTIIPRIDTTFTVIQTEKNGWIPTTQEFFSQTIDVSFTSDTITLVPEGLIFGNHRTHGTLNVKVMINEAGGDIQPEDFTITIINAENIEPNGFRGSSEGTEVILDPGSYQVTILADPGIGPFDESPPSVDCSSRINGEEVNPIGPDETRTCIITINDLTPAPATLNVIKKVINDEAGTLSSNDFTIQVTDNDLNVIEFQGVDGTPGIPGTPVSQILFDDDFSSGLNGWVKYSIGNSPIAVPNPTDNYSLSVISTDGQSAPSAHISGDGYAINAGMKKQITIPADATQVILSFDGKAQGTLPSHESIPNLLLSILDENNQNIYNEYVVGPGNPSSVSVTPWTTYTVDITDQVLGHSQVSIVLGLSDSWIVNYSQKAWFDNVSVEVLTPGGSGTPTTGGVAVTLQPGSFVVSENPPITYTVRYEGECSGTIASGDTKTCVVINEDRPEIVPLVFEENFDDGNLDGWIQLGCSGGTCFTSTTTSSVAGPPPSEPNWGVIGVVDSSPSTNCNNSGQVFYQRTFDVEIPGDYNMKAHISVFHTNNVVTTLQMPGVNFNERGSNTLPDYLRIIDETVHLNPGTYPITLGMQFNSVCFGTLTSTYDDISVTLVE